MEHRWLMTLIQEGKRTEAILFTAIWRWKRIPELAREETRCRYFLGYSLRLTARYILYAPSHSTYVTPVGEHTSCNEKYFNG